jgi:hypothetical protein
MQFDIVKPRGCLGNNKDQCTYVRYILRNVSCFRLRGLSATSPSWGLCLHINRAPAEPPNKVGSIHPVSPPARALDPDNHVSSALSSPEIPT